MDSFLDLYRDPLFLLFPVGASLVSVGSFALFASVLTWLAMRDVAWLRPYRIQPRRPREQNATAIVWPSVRLWVLNNALQFALIVALWPLLRLTGVHAGPLPSVWEVAGYVLLFIYLDDFLYYWMHRAMHRPWLFRRVHSLHHRIPAPWAIAGHYMHPVEYLATAAVMLIGPLALGVHVVTLYAWIVVRQWEASEGHCGYALPWSPMAMVPFGDAGAHHDFHHSRAKGNYGGFLPLWDGVFGTYARGYADDRARRRRDARA